MELSDDEAVDDLFVRFRASGDRRLRNQLIESHRWLAIRCAHGQFDRRGEPLDDLVQVAQLGVLKAVERFEPERGVPFAAFAMPTVLGELKRHFRDATWAVHVPRRQKDLHVALAPATERLTKQLGRAPTVDELAAELGETVDQVLEAIEAGAAYRTGSFAMDAEHNEAESAALGVADDDIARVDDLMAVRRLLASLPARERRIVYLRYFEEMSQSAIAADVGVSQMQVSRLLRATLRRLGSELHAEVDAVTDEDVAD